MITYAYGDDPRVRGIDCPLCGQAVRLDRRGASVIFRCDARCDPSAIAAKVDVEALLSELVLASTNGANGHGHHGAVGGDETAAEKLTQLLNLTKVGLSITGGRVVGRGSTASADLHLSDDTTITFDSLRDVANPSRLALEITACTGATPTLKAREALCAVALLRELAEHEETLTADQIAVDWGCSYLQAAEVLDADLGDQASRWRAFEIVAARDPYALARERGISLEAASLVLRDADGTRLVRCGWFRNAIRSQDSSISPQQLAHRMKRVGWQRRRIKATRPSSPGERLWEFYAAPAGWQVNE